MTRKEIRELTIKLIRKDAGDQEIISSVNSFIDIKYREVKEKEGYEGTATLTLDENGEADLPIDYLEDNYVVDSDNKQINYTILGSKLKTYLTSQDVTLYYFKQVSDLKLATDNDKPLIKADHTILAFGAAELFKLTKDDTLKDDFGAIYNNMFRNIRPIIRKSKSINTTYSV